MTEEIDRRLIFERDGWLCRLCTRPVRPDVPPNHPREPTIDHILPASLGGSYTYDNLWTACRQCNSKKGNRVSQLALGM
jgi:5-methylcytosine-specific restriction endonuclease McrA